MVMTTISMGVVSNLAYDLLKRARGKACTPIENAVTRTVGAFPNAEGLKETLEEWLASPSVSECLQEYVKGLKGLDDIRVERLAQVLTNNTRFFLPDGAAGSASEPQRIVSDFLTRVREEYLRSPNLGLTLVANRLQDHSAQSMAALNDITAGLEEVKARLPITPGPGSGALFDSQLDEAKGHLEKFEYELAWHICDKLRRHNWDELSYRQRFRGLTIAAAAAMCEGRTTEGARLFIEAKAWQPDDDKALGNEARAYHLLDQTEKAFKLATQGRERFPNSSLLLVVWLNTAPRTEQLEKLESAIPPNLADDVEVLTALAHRALVSGENRRAEAIARRATNIKADWAYPWAVLAESIFRSEMPEAAEDYGRITAFADESRLRLAEEACAKAIELSKRERQTDMQASVLLVRAELRRALGDDVAADEDTIAAWFLKPGDPVVLRDYARVKLQRGEKDDAIEKLRMALDKSDRSDLRMLLALALNSTGRENDRTEATQIYESVIARESAPEVAGPRMQAVLAALQSLAKQQRWGDGHALIARVSGAIASPTFGEVLQAKWELSAGNKERAAEVASSALGKVTPATPEHEVRLLAIVLADLGRHREALALWQRIASPRHLGYDTSHLIDCALRLGEHRVFLALCEQLRSNGVWDKQLIEVEAAVLEHYDQGKAVSVLQGYLAQFPEDRATRLHLSVVGLRAGRPELVTADPASMPTAEEVPPEDWKLIVHVMRSGGFLTEALRFAYSVLRSNFQEPEAHRAYLAAMLTTGPRPSIPSPDYAGPGTAVAFREDGSTQEEWRVVEEEFKPDPGLQEIAPDHFIAQQLNGKHVGDIFLVAQGSVISTKAKITQILSKYVYRFQECGANWQRRFPTLPDIQSLRVVKINAEGAPEIDLTEFLGSLDRIAAHQHDVIAAYRFKTLPMHLLADGLGRNEFEQTVRVALDDGLAVKCCAGTAEERDEALVALKNASEIVLDLSAIVTMSLLGRLEELGQFAQQFLISEATLSQLNWPLVEEDAEEDGRGFVGKQDERYVLQEIGPEVVREQRRFLKSTVDAIRVRSAVVGCPDLAAVPPEQREFLVNALGEHGAQTLVLASAPRRILWADDLALSLIGKHAFGVRRIWTQVALQERAESGALKPDLFFEATAKLLGWRYYFTSTSVPALIQAGALAEWNPAGRPLRQALEPFSDPGIPVRQVLALAIGFMAHYANQIALPEARGTLTVQILESLAKRGEGLAFVNMLIMGVPVAFGVNVVRANEFVQVIRTWAGTRQQARRR